MAESLTRGQLYYVFASLYALTALVATILGYGVPTLQLVNIATAIFIITTRRNIVASALVLADTAVLSINILIIIKIFIIIIIGYVRLRGVAPHQRQVTVCSSLINATIILTLVTILYILIHYFYLGKVDPILYEPLSASVCILAALQIDLLLMNSPYGVAASILIVSAAPLTLTPLIILNIDFINYILKQNKRNIRNINVIREHKGYIVLGRVVAELSPRRLWSAAPLRANIFSNDLAQDTGWYWKKSNREYKLTITKANTPHILVLGATGSGKSTLVKTIISRILSALDNSKVIIVDTHGEYIDFCSSHAKTHILKAGDFTINLLEPPAGMPPKIHALNIVALITNLYKLGPLQQNLLYSSIITAFEEKGIDIKAPFQGQKAPSLTDVRNVLQEVAKTDARALNLLLYIDMFSTYFSLNSSMQGVDYLIRMNDCIVIDLSRLAMPELRLLYIDTFFKNLYTFLINNNNMKYFIIIDEAQNYLSKTTPSPYSVKIFTELRKYNAVAIASTQQASILHREVLANSGHVLALRHADPREARYVAHILSSIYDQKRINAIEYALTALPKGFFITKEEDTIKTIIVKILNN